MSLVNKSAGPSGSKRNALEELMNQAKAEKKFKLDLDDDDEPSTSVSTWKSRGVAYKDRGVAIERRPKKYDGNGKEIKNANKLYKADYDNR